MKRSAFTLVETLVSLLMISAVGMASMLFVSGYLKTTYDRDRQSTAAIRILSATEECRAEVASLSQLYSFIQGKNVRVTAVGIGEISLNSDGTYNIINPESFGFSDKLLTDKPTIFRLDFGGEIPNTKMIAVVRLR